MNQVSLTVSFSSDSCWNISQVLFQVGILCILVDISSVDIIHLPGVFFADAFVFLRSLSFVFSQTIQRWYMRYKTLLLKIFNKLSDVRGGRVHKKEKEKRV